MASSDSEVSEKIDARKPEQGAPKVSDGARSAAQPVQEPVAVPTLAPGKDKEAAAATAKPVAPASAASNTASPSAEEESTGETSTRARQFWLFQAVPSWMISMVVHAGLLMIMAVITLPDMVEEKRILAVANPTDVEEVENLDNEQLDPVDAPVFEGAAAADTAGAPMTTNTLDVPSLEDSGAAPDQFKLEDFGDMVAPSNDLTDRIGGGMAQGLGESRGAKARKGAVERGGGSEGSERSVVLALKWLAAHQERDGGWNFDHTRGPCKGQCSHPGMIPPSRNAATAMALLPFLGAGQTHKEGEYKETVQRGLTFLVQSAKVNNGMADLSDAGGRMYSHGMASIALCEAYAMTADPDLLQPAQFALNYIVFAQDPVGGGWRYEPKQAGDTSVVGWQLMALKSGHMAYLKVPPRTILGATKFLDNVQDEGGAKYGYTSPGASPSTTAVGLLCRMYLGWKHEEPALQAGVRYLTESGPSENMYYNYYATQVMRHYGGTDWETWNSKLRDEIIKAQDTKGHENGSWFYARDPWADRGGRLYCTSLATMILEVYYRHLPIYGKQAAEDDFPL